VSGVVSILSMMAFVTVIGVTMVQLVLALQVRVIRVGFGERRGR
jgi:hypothetical protein